MNGSNPPIPEGYAVPNADKSPVSVVIRHYSVLCVVKAITCRISRLPRPLQDVTRCYEDRYVTHDYTLRNGMKAQS